VLLAAYDTRRPTRDPDFAGQRLTNQVEGITTLVRDIATIRVEDGLRFDADSARGETIREADLYSGVRVHLSCRLPNARTHLKVDVTVGDPITPAPQHVHVPRLLDQSDTIDLVGYPLPMVHAEKIVAAIQRGAVNTRRRDFADIDLLCHHPPVDAAALREALAAVAGHRGKGGALVGPNPTDRGKNGSKYHLLTDRARHSVGGAVVGSQHSRQHAVRSAAAGRSRDQGARPWTASAPAGQAARRQGPRPQTLPGIVEPSGHQGPHRPPRSGQ
jgi:hypothetical protein